MSVKVKRPKWAVTKNRRWKVVTEKLQSPINPSLRSSNFYSSDKGTILVYPVGTVVVSPNGVDSRTSLTCSNGIHAYRSLKVARANRQRILNKIIIVYAPEWFGSHSSKTRAKKVYVSSIHRDRGN